jgi:hypothetical protein
MNQQFQFTILMAISFLVVIINCSKKSDDITGISSNEKIIPLAVGNKWLYTTYNVSTGAEQATLTIEIFGKINDSTYWRRHTVDYFDKSYYYMTEGVVALEKDGYHEGNLANNLLFKYPTKKGDTYIYGTVFKIKVADLKASVTVPAGTFKCVRYDFYLFDAANNSYRLDDCVWIAPNVGEIARAKTEDASFFRELQTYKLQPF